MEREIDARGLSCPQPVVLARKALMEAEPGERIKVLIDDKASVENLERFAGLNGYAIEISENEEGFWEVVVEGKNG